MSGLSRPLSTFVQKPHESVDCIIDLGTRGVIRVNDKQQFSVFDVIEQIAGKINPRDTWNDAKTKFPEVVAKCYYFQFPGQDDKYCLCIAIFATILLMT